MIFKVHQDRSCYDESNAICFIEIGPAVLEIDGGGQNLPLPPQLNVILAARRMKSPGVIKGQLLEN